MHETILHLSLIPDIGPSVVEKLARVLPFAQLHEIYHWSLQDFRFHACLSERAAEAVVQGLMDRQLLDRELKLIAQHAIRWVSIDDPIYPQALKNTHLPPMVLYWQGADLAVLERSVAIVGARKANIYGQRVVEKLVPDFVQAGFAIVSGGAIGADTMAHQATVRAGGVTAAVIGAGLLRPYPISNKRLFTTIIEQGGVVMSPFPLTMEALPGNFPARNRIIAGLSQATVVVQAAEKSGALITAMFALEQGREVGAVPGHIDDPLSAGCHALLREGAVVVRSAEDIIMPLGGEIVVPQRVREHQEVVEAKPKKAEKDPIVAACASPQLFDDLCNLLRYDETHLQDRLMTLQLEGVLEQDIMGRWYSVI